MSDTLDNANVEDVKLRLRAVTDQLYEKPETNLGTLAITTDVAKKRSLLSLAHVMTF